ncbi:MAG: hypothetical protein IJO40_01465, partial [Thermoguttaceae bacterium]|nr:hypothetical protein [Thermoguttaceae bacterium]
MFSSFLVNKAEKVLSEYFPLGCRASTRTRDFALFCEKLQAETGMKLDLNANEALDLLKLAGTCVDGLVYPFKTLEPKPEKSPTNNSRQTTNINTSERKESGKSIRTFGAEVLKIKRIPRDQIPSDTVKLIANVLYKNFKTGFSLRSAADMKRFRSLVRSLDSDSVLNRESDASLRQLIASVGCCVDGNVYIILKTGQNYLTQLVEGLWRSGCGVVYYETLFERYKTTLREHRFETLAVLQDRLRVYFRNAAFHDEYFEQTQTSGSEPKKVLNEIERVWRRDDELELDVLASWMFVPKSKIRAYLNASPKYAYRGEGVYAKKAMLCNVSETLENDSTQAPNLNRQNATAPLKPVETSGVLGESARDLLQSILTERFANGFRLTSTIEASRLRKYAQETGGEEGAAVARLDDAALRNAVRKSGVVCDDKVYVVDKATDATIRAEVESAFDSGAKAIFYESLFERVAASAPDYFSLELLKDRVRSLYAVSDRKIRFAENYLNIYIY